MVLAMFGSQKKYDSFIELCGSAFALALVYASASIFACYAAFIWFSLSSIQEQVHAKKPNNKWKIRAGGCTYKSNLLLLKRLRHCVCERENCNCKFYAVLVHNICSVVHQTVRMIRDEKNERDIRISTPLAAANNW